MGVFLGGGLGGGFEQETYSTSTRKYTDLYD